jgi:hypothetical protein
MRSSALALLGLTALAAASPLRRSTNNNLVDEFKNVDGFPTPSAQQLLNINQQAHGTLSNGSPPPTISNDTIISLQVIAGQEFFESAYFQQLLTNVTNGVDGFYIENWEARELTVSTLEAVVAQEQLHALNAVNALKHFNQTPIEPCEYNFPVATFEEAITLAQTFTSVVLGTLQNVVLNMGLHGDAPLSQGVASVIGQEGEQEGFFRLLNKKIPNELPFLTNSVRDFAFNALNQAFIVPGSCPNINDIAALKELHPMEPLTVVTPFDPSVGTEVIELSFDLASSETATDYVVAYINQQNVPITETLTVTKTEGTTVYVTAAFPFKEHELNGLTIAAIIPSSSATNLTSNQAVADVTKAGPGLLLVN